MDRSAIGDDKDWLGFADQQMFEKFNESLCCTDHITLQAMRMQAVKAVGGGTSVKDVAKAYGLSQRIVFKWLAIFASGGQNALRAKPISGRPPLAWIFHEFIK